MALSIDPGARGPIPEALGSTATTVAAATAGDIVDDPVISLRDVIRIYREADVETIALRGIDLDVGRGEFVAVMGRSGSGKSTLLQLIAGADRPTAGRVIVDGIDLSRADESIRSAVRGRRVGSVFQAHNLVPFLSVAENVGLAAALAGRRSAPEELAGIIRRVGLEDRRRNRPSQLSGGEQQRAAVALVLAARPAVLLADEVTGELDSASAEMLVDLVEEVNTREGITVILATHDHRIARRARRIVELRDGRVVRDGRPA